MKPVKEEKGSKILGNFDVDEDSDRTVGEQLADALRSQGGRVMDLFREWDIDGDGTITRKEFLKAMPRLGLEVSKDAINQLFDSWDPDGSGELNFKELQRILRGGGTAKPKEEPAKVAKEATKAADVQRAAAKFAKNTLTKDKK